MRMPHLCYIYIYEFKCLKDVELAIDTRYNYRFDKERSHLSINKTNLPDKFWGAGVCSLAAIFGNNGAGKSTAIEFILNAIIDASGNEYVNGIVVFEEGGELCVYNPHGRKRLTVDIDGRSIHVDPHTTLPDINTFFYTGHYVADYSYARIQTINLTGFHNASDGCLLRTDLEKFANTSDSYLNLPFGLHLTAHIFQNNYRICRLLLNKRLRKTLPEFNFPQYILLTPNKGGYYGLKSDPIRRNNAIEEVTKYLELPHIHGFIDSRNQTLAQFVHFNILNTIAEPHLLGSKSTILKRWYDFFKPTEEVMPQLKFFASNQNGDEEKILNQIFDALTRMSNDTLFNEKTGVFYIDAIKESEKAEKFIEDIFNTRFYLTSRIFDVFYSHDKDTGGSTLSSGEQKMLDLFSRLYSAIELDPQAYNNLNSPSLLVLDEAEIGFHPEWQCSFIKTLIGFLNSLYVIAGLKFQIVLTSHYPILLSDIPACCCNFLKRDYENKSTMNLRNSHEETFASNIFDLYRDSFFLDKGLVGAFAEDKLMYLQKRIEQGETDLTAEIEMIGDQRLKSYFMHLLHRNLLNSDNREAMIRYYRKKLQELEEDQHE